MIENIKEFEAVWDRPEISRLSLPLFLLTEIEGFSGR